MPFSDKEIVKMLTSIRGQPYPLKVSEEQAQAMCCCIQRIMFAASEDDQVMLRGDYNLVTSALHHPAGED